MSTPDTIAEEASAWFARARSGQITEAESVALEAWLAGDPARRLAYEDLQLLWAGLDSVRGDPAVLALREAAGRDLSARRRDRLTRTVMAACAVLALTVGGGIWLGRHAGPGLGRAAVYQTRVGQTASIGLPDGSLAVLDTDSELRVWPNRGRERRLELVRGRAYFKVAKDPARPFIVRADGKDVTALGTRFDVYLKEAGLEVMLMEGRVRVQPHGSLAGPGQQPSVEMTPGYRLVARRDGWGLVKADIQAEAGWMQGRLVFDEDRVGDIARELNRYATHKIVIVDPAVGDRRMSAVIEANDASTFIAALEVMKLARSRPRADGGFELRTP